MITKELIEQRYKENLQRLRDFRLFDDDFMTKCFEDSLECISLVLQIVLDKPNIKVIDVRTQVFVENLLNRSVILDVLATDDVGRKYNVEVQRSDKGADKKRARYNSSMLDVNVLKKGEDFDKLPDTFTIFITENDVIGKGLPLYKVERSFLETDELFDDGSYIIYVNGEYRGNDPLGRLLHDFSCTQPSDMNYEILAERVRYFKESKEGVYIMCKAMEDMIKQELREVAKKMLADKTLPIEKIAEYSRLSIEEVKELEENKNV